MERMIPNECTFLVSAFNLWNGNFFCVFIFSQICSGVFGSNRFIMNKTLTDYMYFQSTNHKRLPLILCLVRKDEKRLKKTRAIL